ncbi:MAG: putative primase/helicase [Methanolobus sp.]|nr:putative primase/helicase [Methanolobus sp.]
MNTGNVPPELRELPQWVMWKYEERDGRLTKIPYTKDGRKAESNNPDTWTCFDVALKCLNNGGGFDGIGFMFSQEDDFCGIDWDHVRNKETGEWEPGILEEIKSFNSYAEVSPSGAGAHVICIGEVPGDHNRKGNREMYDKLRYFTFTGDIIEGTPLAVRPAQKAINKLYRERIDPPQKEKESEPRKATPTQEGGLSDEEIIRLCKIARNGEKFKSLWSGCTVGYPSQSEADQALCSILAFYTQDEMQIDSLFRSSGLYREKWERRDYRDRTIRAAIDGLREKYTPEREAYRSVERSSTRLNSCQDLGGQALKLFESVEKVTIVKGHIPTDPTNWEIRIDGHVLSVDAEKMDRPTLFRKQYLKVFNKSPPAFKEDWPKFVDALSELAEVVTAKEESESVYIANQLMETIRKLPIITDKEDAAVGRGLLDHEGHYCLVSKKLDEIKEAHNYHITPNLLSSTMVSLGLKADGTPTIRCGTAGRPRFWWFYKRAIIDSESQQEAQNKEYLEGVV